VRFCSQCGGPLGERILEGKPRAFCPACGKVFYQNQAPVAVCIVEAEGGIVLIKRANEPGLGEWALPGGYVDYDEDVEDAARRETFEETGLKVRLDGVIAAHSFFEPGKHGVAIFFRATPIGGALLAGDDAAEVAIFPPDALPPIAFDTHRWALARHLTPCPPLQQERG
jgi:ADP-ribose pyrophosphatase YjhB (NUDIX family)